MEGVTGPISEERRQVLDNGQASKNEDGKTNPLTTEQFIELFRLFQSFKNETHQIVLH